MNNLSKILIPALASAFFSCGPKIHLAEEEGMALGTFYSIKYYTPADTSYRAGYEAVFDAVNRSLSIYDENSIVSKINRGENVPADSLFSNVLQQSQTIWQETGGWFDPTVGRAVNAWGFGPGPVNELEQADIDFLHGTIGLDKVIIQGDRIVRKNPETQLDFNAIAKGYTVDLVAGYFDRQGIESYMIEIGGEIRTRGIKADGKPWTIGIEDPTNKDASRTRMAVLTLKNESIATSGNYRKYKTDKNGRKYVHTINPKTAQAIENDILSASVVAPECAAADAYATALMAMGIGQAREFLAQRPGFKAYLVYIDQNGQLQTQVTPALQPKIK